MVARYWGHVFGGKVLRVDGIGAVMHAGSFSVNRRWRAQNGTGAAAFGGVGREISKIHIPISHDNKLSNNHKK